MISLNSVIKIILISNMLILFFAILLSANNILLAKKQSKIKLTNLRVEYKTNPIGIDVLIPADSTLISGRNFLSSASANGLR